MRVNPVLLSAKARVLNETRVQYAKKDVKTRGATWNLLGHKFSGSGEVKSWAWLYVEIQGCGPAFSQPKPFNDVVSEFRKSMGIYGIKIRDPLRGEKLRLGGQDDGNIETFLKEASENVKLLWIIIPPGMTLLYDRIKYFADVKFGLATVVSVDSKLAKSGLSQYLGNEALKINLKLGGQNQASSNHTLSRPGYIRPLFSPPLCGLFSLALEKVLTVSVVP